MNTSKKTLIIGASANPQRYAYMAALRLTEYGHPIEMIGMRADEVAGQIIHTEKIVFDDIHTVTLYVGVANQIQYYDYIVSLQPKRVIFNPGTENPELESFLRTHGINYELACTLVLLETNQY